MIISHGRSLNFNLMTVLAVVIIGSAVGLLSVENAYAVPNYFYVKSIQTYDTPGGFLDHPTGIARDSSGNLYVADNGNNRVIKYDSVGNFLLDFGSFGTAQGQFNGPNGVALDSSGNVYVVDTNNNRIEKFSSSGAFIRQFGNGFGTVTLNNPLGIFINATNFMYVTDSSNNLVKILNSNGDVVNQFNYPTPGFNNPAGIAIDSSGNILVIDSGHGKVVKFTKNGNFISTFSSQGSGNGQLTNPRGISVMSSGNILVADTDNNRIEEFSSSGGWLTTWASGGTTGNSGDGLSHSPTEFAIDPITGGFYFTDQLNHRVQKLDSTGHYLAKFGNYAVNQFLQPNGVRVDSSGNLYVADTSHSYVSKFDSTGNFVTGIGRDGSDNGQFQGPVDVAFDISGNLLVSDQGNLRVQNFTTNGVYQSQFGSALFNTPSGITLDSLHNIYVVDNGNNDIQKFDPSGNNPTVFASGLNFPSYAAINSTGYLFVTNTGSNQINYYSPSGVFQGAFGSSGTGNGQFNSPSGIAIDSSGDILVSDQGNNRIQVFDSHRNYLTQFGGSGSGTNQFNAPIGMALDNLGNVYVADSNNNRIEVFSTSLPSASITISPLGTPTARWGVDTVSISGIVVNPSAGDTVTITWGDGSTSTATITITGTTGTWTATHTYPSTAVGTNNIVATLVNGVTTKATSNTVPISITAHHTSLTLTLQTASSLPWGAPISVTGKLTDTDASPNVGVPSQSITFTGSGVGTLAVSNNTLSDGTFTNSGNATSSASPSLTISANYGTNPAYLSSNTASVTYQTLKHNTSLTLNPIPNILPGAPITVTGMLTDTNSIPVPNSGISSKSITFTASLGTIIPTTTTDPNGAFTNSGIAPSSVSSVDVQANFAGDTNYASSSYSQTYNTLQQSISFTSPSSPARWGLDVVSISGKVVNPATSDSVTITWGDGSTSNGITIATDGTWTTTHTYPSNAVGTNNIVATLVNGATTPPQATGSVSIIGHLTSLTLSLQTANSLPWGAPISVTGKLTDTDANVPLSSQPITFTGSGVGTITGVNTVSDGTFTAPGNAPVPPVIPSSGLTIQAQFATNGPYLSSNIPSVTYQTLKHNTSLTLNPVSSVPSGNPLTATGILTDTDAANVGVYQKSITYGGTGGSLFNTATTLTETSGAYLTSVSSGPPASNLQLQSIFAGDSFYGPSTSVQQTFSVFPPGGTPTIAISLPSSGQVINNTSITISGTASDSTSGVANVQVSTDGGITFSPATGTTSWSITTTVTPGPHTIIAKVTNNSGGTATSSISVISRPLNAPVITTSSSTTNNPVQTISGTADSNVPIKIYDGTTLIGTTVSDSSGHWSLHVTLASGTNTISAKEVTTDATSSSSNTITITVDTVPPTIAISFPLNNAILHTLTFSVTGTASDSISGVANVQVKIDSDSYQPVTGTTSWSITTTVTPGPHTITAQATDNAGNISTTSVSITIKSSEGKVTGGGKISKDTEFGFNVNSEDKGIKGHLEFQDKSQNIKLDSTSITFLSINPSSTNANFFGTAKVNGNSGYTFSAYVEDNGEPGRHDVFGITIFDSNGVIIYPTNTGVLTEGNIQIHKSGPDDDHGDHEEWKQWNWSKWPWNHENGNDGNGKKS